MTIQFIYPVYCWQVPFFMNILLWMHFGELKYSKLLGIYLGVKLLLYAHIPLLFTFIASCFSGLPSRITFCLLLSASVISLLGQILYFVYLKQNLFQLQSSFFKFIYFWLCWVSLLHVSFLKLQCTGFSLRWPPLLWSMGSRLAGFSSCSGWS